MKLFVFSASIESKITNDNRKLTVVCVEESEEKAIAMIKELAPTYKDIDCKMVLDDLNKPCMISQSTEMFLR